MCKALRIRTGISDDRDQYLFRSLISIPLTLPDGVVTHLALLILLLSAAPQPPQTGPASPRQAAPLSPAQQDFSALTARLQSVSPGQGAEPRLGYTQLWRAVFGDREHRDPEEHFATGSGGSELGGPELDGRRGPRLRTARWVSVAQQFYDLPLDDSSYSLADPETGWSSAADITTLPEQPGAMRHNGLATTAVTAGYVPSVIEQIRPVDQSGSDSNFLVTMLVGIVASVLLLVIIFMPR